MSASAGGKRPGSSDAHDTGTPGKRVRAPLPVPQPGTVLWQGKGGSGRMTEAYSVAHLLVHHCR